MFTYSLFILGCQFNYYDAEKLARVFDALGGSETDDIDDADIVVVFACSVRQKAVDRLLGHIHNWRKTNSDLKVIVTACVLPGDKKKLSKKVDLVVEEKELLKTPKKLLFDRGVITESRTINDDDTQPKSTPADDNRKTQIKNHGHNLTDYGKSAYITITSGCNNFCTYCAVPYTRGREISKSEKHIISEANEIVNSGIGNIILLGQNVNSYGLSDFMPRDMRKNISPAGKNWTHSNPSPFVKLLRKLDKVDGIDKISFLSPNPQDMSSDIIGWMKTSSKFSKNLNLPMQSGSSKILKKMNRRYSRKEYLELVTKIRAAVPDIFLSTDIIVGFPGETEADFKKTLDAVNHAKFDKAFIAIYSPRAGTAASRMDDNVDHKTKKRRWLKLDSIINS